MLLGAPPNIASPCINYIGYHNLLRATLAGAPVASSGDGNLALDWLPFTNWNPSNSGDKTLTVDLDWDAENMLLYSEDFTNAVWTGTAFGNDNAATETANTDVAPDGTTTADTSTANAAPAPPSGTVQRAGVIASQMYTYSIWVKDSTGATLPKLRVDYGLNGALVSTQVNSPIANSTSWVRLSTTFTIPASGVNQVECGVHFAISSGSIKLWGAQLVKGSVPKPYAVTTTAAEIPPSSAQNPTDTPELYTANYGALYAYDLGGGVAYLDYWNPDTFAYVNFMTFTAADLASAAPLMKLTGSVTSYRWRVRLVGVPHNLLLYSEQFNNAAWTKTDTTITANSIVAPDETATADLLTEGVAGTSSVLQGAAITAGRLVTHSRYIKRGNSDWIFMAIVSSDLTKAVRAWFNVATGQAGTSAVTGSPVSTYQAHGMESVGGGWYRCYLTGAINDGSTTVNCQTLVVNGDGSTTRVNNSTRYEWGGQLEQSALAPSAYMMTTTAAVTFTALLGVVNIGQWLGIPMQDVGWTPPRLARKAEVLTNVSDAGQFLGRSLVRQASSFDITATFLPADWAYEAWLEFMQHAEIRPFFFKWDIAEAGDTVFCWLEDEVEAPEFSGSHNLDAVITVRGAV